MLSNGTPSCWQRITFSIYTTTGNAFDKRTSCNVLKGYSALKAGKYL